MKIKQIGVLALCLGLLTGIMAVPALALDSGVYTGSVVTSYYNPDTGNIDDGGTANAALGEGMCRSATGETALVEVDADGNTWLTIRLLLQSSCKNITFYTRTDYDSYSQVSYDIMAEDSGNDSIDYRFKVSDADMKLKCTMYVTPMGRDVLWYLYVDTSSLASGSGDFVVSIDTGDAAETTPEETEAPTETVTPTATPAASETPETTESPASSATPESDDTQTEVADESDESTSEEIESVTAEVDNTQPEVSDVEDEPADTETVAVTEDTDTVQTEATEESAEPTPEESETVMVEADDVETEAEENGEVASDETEASIDADPAASSGTEVESDEDTSDETAETDDSGMNAGAIAGIVIAIVIIGGIIVIILRRKK